VPGNHNDGAGGYREQEGVPDGIAVVEAGAVQQITPFRRIPESLWQQARHTDVHAGLLGVALRVGGAHKAAAENIAKATVTV
jgi:hypothetical protein